MIYLFIILTIALTCYLLCRLILPVLKMIAVVDIPNERSSHSEITIRGGGVVIILCALGAFCIKLTFDENWTMLWLSLIVGVLAGVSFIDDLISVGSGKRFIIHFATAVTGLKVAGLLGHQIVCLELGGLIVPTFAAGLLALVWVAGYTNAFNFMDGINGIACLQGVITGWSACFLAFVWGVPFGNWAFCLSLFIGASCLGFVPHNFPRARMFMGDVGSAPLGMMLSLTVLGLGHATDWSLLFPLVLLHANFVLDTGITLLRRILSGEEWYTAHRNHFYQRLQRSGKSHSFVTILEMSLQLLVVGLMWLYLSAEGVVAAILVGLVSAIWLGFFWYCEREFRLSQSESP